MKHDFYIKHVVFLCYRTKKGQKQTTAKQIISANVSANLDQMIQNVMFLD